MSREPFIHPSDEERVAAEVARDLESITVSSSVRPTDGFADRVMLAIAHEPLPQPVWAFGLAVFGGHLGAAGSALGDAWRTISSAFAPAAVRAQAFALVLVVLVGSVALAGGAAVGAVGLISGTPGPAPTGPPPSLSAPSMSPSPTPSPIPERSPDAKPSRSPEETGTAEPTETLDATKTPTTHETPRPTEHPRTAQPTESDDDGGSGSGSGGGDHTPSPTETDDSSGGDG